MKAVQRSQEKNKAGRTEGQQYGVDLMFDPQEAKNQVNNLNRIWERSDGDMRETWRCSTKRQIFIYRKEMCIFITNNNWYFESDYWLRRKDNGF